MDPLDTQIDPLSIASIPYDQKWDILKPTIERLYVRENRKLKDIIAAIRHDCGFTAVESQYKYQIKKWQFKKSTSTAKKVVVYNVVKSRAQLGKSSAISKNGQILETKNLRRYLKKEARREMVLHSVPTQATQSPHFLSHRMAQFGNGIFMHWNMPYGIMKATSTEVANHTSPLSGIDVATPPSPKDAPSPLTIAVKRMTAVERTRLLVEGKYSDFLMSMEQHQRLAMSTWLYHFWLFSFKTAKHWGRGPQTWTADILGLDTFRSEKPIVVSSPATSTPQNTPRSINMIDDACKESTTFPSSLCRWSIHVHEIPYEGIVSPPHSPPAHIDLDDEKSWPAWSASCRDKVTEKLNDGLVRNTFTNVKPSELPIATDQIIRAVKRSPQEIHQEALGFSIMSRNMELVRDLLNTMDKSNYKINGLYPFHLAIAYLDGSKACCNILDLLVSNLPPRQYFANDLGHTVLDQIMISILKSHTSCTPNVVDSSLKNQKRFEGAEVDVCGRWDADSTCVRELLAKGESSVPFGWKHMFCHTSVQAICHAIGILFGPTYRPDINTPSGLFTRRCSHCGLKLQLRPLHALVMVGFHLSVSGCKDENLFGILACLLCLLSYGADPRLKADIYLQSLWGEQDSDRCSHEEIDPAELLESLVASFAPTWCEEIATSWNVITYVLRQSQAEWNGEPIPNASTTASEADDSIDYSDDEPDSVEELDSATEKSIDISLPAYCSYWDDRGAISVFGGAVHPEKTNYFGRRRSLATLWAAVKTELLTYRRLTENDAWLSRYFDMKTLNQGLIQGGKVTMPLVDEAMMKPFCECGNFVDSAPGCTVTDEACAFFFSNMEEWNRTNFILSAEGRHEYWHCEEDE